MSIITEYVEKNVDDPDDMVEDTNEKNSSFVIGLGKYICEILLLYILSNIIIVNSSNFMSFVCRSRYSIDGIDAHT